eukprot:gene20620-19998_t
MLGGGRGMLCVVAAAWVARLEAEAVNGRDGWLAKRESVIRTIWDDGQLPLNRTEPDAVEATNVTGLQLLTQGQLTRDLVIQHEGHLYTNWNYTSNCFRGNHAACYNDTTEVCDLSCSYYDTMNTSKWMHDELGLDYMLMFMPLMSPNALPPGTPGRVHLLGLSGGGWTVTLAAAIDPRIHVSIPLAGSLPWYLFGAHQRARCRGTSSGRTSGLAAV